VMAGCLLLLFVPFILLSGSAVSSFLSYHAQRGLQVESSFASLLLVYRHIAGQTLEIRHAFGAWQVEGASSSLLASLSLWAVLLVQVLIIAWYARRTRAIMTAGLGGQHMAHGMLVSLLALLITSKVFSPQFLVWVAPLTALMAGPLRREMGRWLPLAMTVNIITGIHFRFLYNGLLQLRLIPAVLVLARNVLLGWLLIGLLRRSPENPSP
jgi:hypothetical protein